MTSYKRQAGYWRAFFSPLAQNRLLCLLYLLLFPLLTLLDTVVQIQFERQYGMPWCLADQLCSITAYPFLGLLSVVLFLYLINHMIKYSFTIPVVIRQRNKVFLWFHQICQTAVAALAMTLYILCASLPSAKDWGWKISTGPRLTARIMPTHRQ